MQAYKSMDIYMYLLHIIGWINNAAIWKVKSKKFFFLKTKASTNKLTLDIKCYCINIVIVYIPWASTTKFISVNTIFKTISKSLYFEFICG